ncbi:PAS domain-containing protein [Desulfogranum japonicum]|uniref:PAS domain-containing protein n=1 Tax=Desulfogranum japonicum TaxID=231447 RepID=UPI000411069F|nr:PAS domain-containing protein [Desulfogranum japonicum]
MIDENKDKSQLIDELRKMRKRVAKLEQQRAPHTIESVHNCALQESEERLRLVLEATNDGIWDWGTETGQVYFSPSYYTMLGYEPNEFAPTYESWRQLVHPDDLEASEAVVQKALKDHTPFSIEFRMKAKNNAWHWILSRGKAIEKDTEGKPLRMVGSHTDITQRKQIEESLRLARFIIDTANIGIQLIRSDGQIQEVNPKAAELTGYSKEELETLSISDIDPEVDSKSWDLLWQNLIQRKTQYLLREHTRKDGSVIPVEIFSNSLEYQGNLYSVAFVQDISERKQAEESLRITQFIFEKAPIGIWKMGRDAQVLDVNEQGCKSLGYSKEKLCGMAAFDFTPELQSEDWAKGIDILDEVGSRSIEVQHQRRNGEIFPVQIVENLIRFEGKEFHVAFVQDITERKQKEEILREKDRLLHDIGKMARIGAWKFDPKTNIARTTDEVARIYDIEHCQDVPVETGLSFYHGVHRTNLENAIWKAVEKATPYDLELEMISANPHDKDK